MQQFTCVVSGVYLGIISLSTEVLGNSRIIGSFHFFFVENFALNGAFKIEVIFLFLFRH